MLKYVPLGVLACAVVLGGVNTAHARHHRWGNGGCGCPCGQATAMAPAAPAYASQPALPPSPAPIGTTAQANDQSYRSFSAEPAAAPAYQSSAAPAYSASNGDWDTANYHGIPSAPVYYGGGGFSSGGNFNSQNGPGR